MIPAFRLCKTRHLATSLDGEGARINGGRWNSQGHAVVYAAGSLSLATLEVLVHLEDPEVFARSFSWIPLEIPENAVEILTLESLLIGWESDEAGVASRAVGDSWLVSMRSLALRVPSVVTPGEWNFLLNPIHPRFQEITVGKPQSFRPDPRLFR